MKRFLKKSVFFFLPLVIWAAMVLLVDPFNYFGFSALVDDSLKVNNAGKVNSLLYRAIEYTREPCEYMLIGDSRTQRLPIDEVRAVSGADYGSLCINAAKLNEIFDLIRLVNSKKRLKHVVVGINFNMFNLFGYADRVDNVRKMLKNPLRYIYNKNVAEATYLVLKAAVTGKNMSSVPSMTQEEFWRWNIETKAMHWYGKYEFPESLHRDLLALDDYAAENNIELTFVIVPHHREFHDRLVEFGLAEEEARFKAIMSELKATVIDYDFENEITIDKSNFSDPVHYGSNVAHLIIHEVWNDDFQVGRRLSE